ncbi:MAG: aminotransferase class V-fold PLP-dependent enzyme [Pseudomonadota bacterium]
MSALRSDIDPDGLLEFSVVFTDRSLNHMSISFQEVMRDISRILKTVYGADGVAVVPGGGTYAMEAVARQLATDKKCLVIRNGWFSYRWTQIFEAGNIPSQASVLKASRVGDGPQAPFAPAAIENVIATIENEKPAVVFAPHVETSSGIILDDAYLRAVGEAARKVEALFVLDCVASGTNWVDIKAQNVDVLITAPQKGWSGTPCAGFVMMNERALERVSNSQSSSFAADLRKWYEIMQAYEGGAHAYHATMPTDGLRSIRDTMIETESYGFEKVRIEQLDLGHKIRTLVEAHGYASVAAEGFKSPSVVVSYTNEPLIQTGKRFAELGVQIAAGVPLMCDEGEDYMSFRIGLFGLDKLHDVEGCVVRLEDALRQIG